MALKMEDAVDEITGEFATKRDIVASAIFGGYGRADEEFTIKRIGFRIIEGDNVRRTFMLQMRLLLPFLNHRLRGLCRLRVEH